MKKILLFIATLILAFAAPLSAFAAYGVVKPATQNPTVATSTSFTANFVYTGTPTVDFTLFGWIKELNATTWIDQSLYLTDITASTQEQTAVFAVEFNYADLGLQTGKTYLYYVGLKDEDGNEQNMTTMACFAVGMGAVGCTGGGNAPSPAPAPNPQPQTPSPGPSNTFSITNKQNALLTNSFSVNYQFDGHFDEQKTVYAWVGEYVPADGFNYWVKNIFVADVPTNNVSKQVGVTFYFNTIPLTAGKTYGYVLADRPIEAGATVLAQIGAPFIRCFTTTAGDVPCPASSTTQWGSSNQTGQSGNSFGITAGSANIGGTFGVTSGTLSISQTNIAFPPAKQAIGNTSATITGVVSVTLAMPVDLSVATAKSGDPIGAFKPVFQSPMMQPGSSQEFSFSMNGLAPGQVYEFVIKNNISNKISQPMQVITSGGTAQSGIAYSGGLFTYTSGNAGVPGTSVAPEYADTISDSGIVPKCGRSQNAEGTIPEEQLRPCTFDDFMQLVANVIQFGLIILGPIVAIAAIYAGAMIIILGSKADPTAEIKQKRKEYATLLLRIGIGVFIILIAWVVVATIFSALGVKVEYNFLDIVN